MYSTRDVLKKKTKKQKTTACFLFAPWHKSLKQQEPQTCVIPMSSKKKSWFILLVFHKVSRGYK